MQVAPSILSADFGILNDEITAICDGGCDLIHVDVMDGHFVPNMTIGPVVVNAARADHNGARFRFNTPVETLGYVIDGSQRIYFAGDTELFPEMDAIAEDLDVALLPVWGWGPSLGPGHMDPYQAAQALQMLKPRYAIPIHWGTYFPYGLKWLMPRILAEPPRSFASFAARFAPDVKVKIISPGETFRIGA